MDNDTKLDALTNEPIEVFFGGEKFILKRPTIKDYKKIRSYLKEKNVDITDGRLPEDDAVDFGIFLIATLLISPTYKPEELEDKILITDFSKLTGIMEQMGFTKPQPKIEANSEPTVKES